MMKQRFIFLWCLMLPVLVFAQDENSGKGNRVVMVVGKPMTSDDSLMVKQLFFSALHEKTIENFTLATEEFNQVLQIDPANDASMYELPNLQQFNNHYPNPHNLLEKPLPA